MKKGLIGVQLSTIAPAKVPDFDAFRAMQRLDEIGYHCVEISQVPMTEKNVSGFRRAIDELGLNVAACTAPLAPPYPGKPGEYLSDPEDFKKIVEDCHKLDCDMLRIGMLPMNCMTSLDKAMDFIRQTDEIAERLREEGIDLYYHNHHVEFQRFGGKYLLDIIRDNTRNIGFELDIHWIWRGGADPVKVIHDYAGRIRLLHLKDYRIGLLREPEGGLDLSDSKCLAEFRQKMIHSIEYAEVGEGTLPIQECIEAGLEGGSEYFLVEQDDTYGRDPFDSLKISHDNLVAMGYADWF